MVQARQGLETSPCEMSGESSGPKTESSGFLDFGDFKIEANDFCKAKKNIHVIHKILQNLNVMISCDLTQ